MGLISSLSSGFSSYSNNFDSTLESQGSSFLNSLNPSANQGGVVSGVGIIPPLVTDAVFNGNYALHLHGTDETATPIDIIASLPEHFSWHLAADWQPLLSNPSLSGVLGQIFKDASALASATKSVFGINDYTQSATMQIWNSTTPLDFQFPMTFNAVLNPQEEVMLPIQQLMALVSPSLTKGGFIRMPGPTVYDQIQNPPTGYNLSLRIGNAVIFKNVLVTGVSPMFDVMTHKTGAFISAQVDVSFRTTTILTKTDIAAMFNFPSQAATSTTTFSSTQLGQHQGVV